MSLHTVIFIGRSGCGKGTQAELLRNRFSLGDGLGRSILYVETGEHFRRFVRGQGLVSRLSREAYQKDERQPDFLACWMWSSVLIEELEDGMHLVFDGSPRAKDEAEVLTTALRFLGRERPTVIYLNVSRRWSEEKLLKRGRGDDINLGKIDKRLDWFDKDVIPAIEYFRSNPFYRLIEINGEQPIEKVHADIVAEYEYSLS